MLASDFDAAILRTIQTTRIGQGGAVLEVRYNPAAILVAALLFASAMAALAYCALLIKPRFVEAKPDQAAVTKQAKNVDVQLTKIMKLVRAHLLSNEGYAKSLGGAFTKLEALPQSQQFRVIVSLLVEETDRMRQETVALATQLEESGRELATLKTDLGRTVEVALTDPLTGVGNRRRFEADLEKAVATCRNAKTPVSLVMCDIDHFKRVNDSFGHRVGDEVLKMFARTVEASVRGSDSVARYGGEEFVIVLPDTPLAGANHIAERIRTQFASKRLTVRETNQNVGILTASFGVTEIKPGEAPIDAIERADRNLYAAKSKGRNKVI